MFSADTDHVESSAPEVSDFKENNTNHANTNNTNLKNKENNFESSINKFPVLSNSPANESNQNFGIFPFGDFEAENNTEDDNVRCGLECQAKKEIRAKNATGEDKNDSIREMFTQKVIFY